MLRPLHLAAMMTILSCGGALAADNVPRLNVSRTCRDAYGVLQADAPQTNTAESRKTRADEEKQAYKSCMDSENAARTSAAQRWARVRGENRRTCVSMASAIFPSYVELDACLQMYDSGDRTMNVSTSASGAPAAAAPATRAKGARQPTPTESGM